MNGNTGLRIVAALVLIAAVAAVAFFAFQAGVAQGSPITIQSPSGETSPLPYPYYGYGLPFHRPFGFGYGFGCFGPLLAFFFLFLAFRFLFWGPRWGWGRHHYGPWGRHWEDRVPPMFDEWHKRAHNAPDAGSQQPEEKQE